MDRDNHPTGGESGQQRERLLHAVDQAHDMVLLVDDRGAIVYANEAAVTTYGYPRAELLALTIHDLDTDFPPSTWSQHWASLERSGYLTVTVRHRTRDGNVFPVEIIDTWLTLDGDDYSLVVARDLRHRPGSEERAQLMQFSIDHIDESVYWIGPDARIVYANDAACRNLGFASDELLGMSVHDVDPNFPTDIWPLHWDELKQRQRLRFETLHRRRDGTSFPVEISANYLRLGDREYNCAFARDITARKAAEGQLRHMATHDPLSGLPNRTLLHDRMERAIARGERENQRLAVLFIDLDDLQNINVRHGHAVGDRVIGAVAERLLSPLRAVDTVARWGNDQFVVLIPDLSQSDSSEDVVHKLLDTLRLPIKTEQGLVEVTASIGVAIFPDDGHDAETLFKNADIAMYRAKEFGGDTAQFFSADIDPHTSGRIELLLGLRTALLQGELEVHYQPIVATDDGRPLGVEALVRWDHPHDGLLLPDTFLGAAEETGFILELGSFVLERACARLREWRDAGLPALPLTVNLSLRQLRDPELLSRVGSALQQHGLAPEDLVFDLPSGLLAGETSALDNAVRRLAELGVGLAVECVADAPTHLALLQSLRIGVLRLDRSLVATLAEEGPMGDLADALTGAAQRLGAEVLAEGVADDVLLEKIRALGCERIQGYVAGQPMTDTAFTVWLAGHSDRS